MPEGPDWITLAPVVARRRFVDHRRENVGMRVSGRQQPAAAQLDAESPEVVRIDREERDLLRRTQIDRRAVRIQRGAQAAPVERRLVGESDRLNAWYRRDCVEQLSLAR